MTAEEHAAYVVAQFADDNLLVNVDTPEGRLVLAYPKDFLHKIEDIRVVFWFDN